MRRSAWSGLKGCWQNNEPDAQLWLAQRSNLSGLAKSRNFQHSYALDCVHLLVFSDRFGGGMAIGLSNDLAADDHQRLYPALSEHASASSTLFLFFVLANFLPKIYDPSTGGERPLLGSFASAAIALSLFAGAFNIEIFRSGIDAVPKTMVEACESLGYSRRQCFIQVILPLAFRICLPALNNNLINLIKTTTLASAIATPELLYYAGQIYADNFATLEVMLLIWVVYVALVGLLVAFMHWWEEKLRIPGYGN